MQKLISVLLMVTMIAVVTCACSRNNQSALSYSDWEKSQRRSYNATKIQIINAVEKLFKLADNDYIITYKPNGIDANRCITKNGATCYTWHITCIDTEDLTHVAVDMEIDASFFVHESGPHESYSLFFARLDYLLGNNLKWATCEDFGKTATDGAIDSLCRRADDNRPSITIKP
jgi:hypothetical protein